MNSPLPEPNGHGEILYTGGITEDMNEIVVDFKEVYPEEYSESRQAMKQIEPEPFQIEGEYLEVNDDSVIYPLRKAMTGNHINLDSTLEPDKMTV